MGFNVGALFKFTFVGRALDQNILNVRYFGVTAATTNSFTVLQVGNMIIDTLAPSLLDVLSVGYSLEGYKIQALYPTLSAEVSSQHGNGEGTSEGQMLPLQTSCLISLRASTAPPGHRGRMYLAGFNEEQFDGDTNQWTSGPLAAVETFATDLISDINLVDDMEEITLRAVLVTGTYAEQAVIDQAIVRSRPATQRRRSLISGPDDPIFT